MDQRLRNRERITDTAFRYAELDLAAIGLVVAFYIGPRTGFITGVSSVLAVVLFAWSATNALAVYRLSRREARTGPSLEDMNTAYDRSYSEEYYIVWLLSGGRGEGYYDWMRGIKLDNEEYRRRVSRSLYLLVGGGGALLAGEALRAYSQFLVPSP
jgi:hypothetical protein